MCQAAERKTEQHEGRSMGASSKLGKTDTSLNPIDLQGAEDSEEDTFVDEFSDDEDD